VIKVFLGGQLDVMMVSSLFEKKSASSFVNEANIFSESLTANLFINSLVH